MINLLDKHIINSNNKKNKSIYLLVYIQIIFFILVLLVTLPLSNTEAEGAPSSP